MAYAGRMPDRTRTLTAVAVAGLRGMALYGLVTGLGVDYVKDAVTVLTGSSIPADPLPPPPPPPEMPVDQPTAKTASRAPADPVIDALPNPLSQSDPVPIFRLPPIEPILGDPPGPIATATPEQPGVAPVSARPSNNPGSWVSTSDYPSASLRRGEQGTVRFEVAIGTNGRVIACRILASSGSAELDAATCRHVTRRAHFQSASDRTGAKVTGTYAGSIRWVIPQD